MATSRELDDGTGIHVDAQLTSGAFRKLQHTGDRSVAHKLCPLARISGKKERQTGFAAVRPELGGSAVIDPWFASQQPQQCWTPVVIWQPHQLRQTPMKIQ
jgi:hypothetical protein